MDSAIFWKNYTVEKLKEKLSSFKTDYDRIKFVSYAIHEFEVFGIEDVIKHPVKFPKKYNQDSFERFHFYTQLKLSYQLLISTKNLILTNRSYQDLFNNNHIQMAMDKTKAKKRRSIDVIKKYLRENKIRKKDITSSKVKLQPLSKKIYEYDPSFTAGTYRQSLIIHYRL